MTERVRGTALEGAPIVACSSATGEGFGELVAALDAMLAGAPEPEREGRPRLHVDRVFSIKGSGTVVTGTLTGGPLTTGAEVELLPSGTRARVRGLQTHHRDVGSASPVSRVAANLTAERARIARGEVLAPAGLWTATSVLEARIEPVRSLDRPITSRGAFKLHAGAAERDARIRLYDVKQVPADGAFVRITLSEPLVLDVGDRFVLRESGRRRTIAGGIVLDTAPPRRAGPTPTPRLDARAHASRAELPALLVAERRAVRVDDVRSILGLAPEDVDGAVRLGGWWVARGTFDGVGAAVTARLAAFHAEEPAAAGEDVATSGDRSRTGSPPRERRAISNSPTPRSIGSRPMGRSSERVPRCGSRRIEPGPATRSPRSWTSFGAPSRHHRRSPNSARRGSPPVSWTRRCARVPSSGSRPSSS